MTVLAFMPVRHTCSQSKTFRAKSITISFRCGCCRMDQDRRAKRVTVTFSSWPPKKALLINRIKRVRRCNSLSGAGMQQRDCSRKKCGQLKSIMSQRYQKYFIEVASAKRARTVKRVKRPGTTNPNNNKLRYQKRFWSRHAKPTSSLTVLRRRTFAKVWTGSCSLRLAWADSRDSIIRLKLRCINRSFRTEWKTSR